MQELRAAGATEDQIFAARERRFGHDAAERLAELDRQRAEWQERLDNYQVERDLLIAKMPEASAERDAALQSLRTAHFAPAEIARVRALDKANLR